MNIRERRNRNRYQQPGNIQTMAVHGKNIPYDPAVGMTMMNNYYKKYHPELVQEIKIVITPDPKPKMIPEIEIVKLQNEVKLLRQEIENINNVLKVIYKT